MLTNQEIFDKVFNHAQAQHKEYGDDAQSISPDSFDGCLYRCKLNDGRVKMCFVGPFIPDEDYDEHMEGDSVRNLFDNYPDMMLSAGLNQSQCELLQNLQFIHDEHDPEDWDESFAVLAVSYDLECVIKLEI